MQSAVDTAAVDDINEMILEEVEKKVLKKKKKKEKTLLSPLQVSRLAKALHKQTRERA